MRRVALLSGLSAVLVCVSASAQEARLRPDSSEDPQRDAESVHGLTAFMERQGHKPYDLFQRGDALMTLRVMFQDRRFGTWVWMLDSSPTTEHAGTASIWPAWNEEGSTIYVEGTRRLDGRPHAGWFFNADFSRLIPARGGRPAVWAPEDPDLYYAPASPSSNVTRNNWRTGEREVVAEWEPLAPPGASKRVYGLTRDRRHIFVDLPNRGIFVPFERDEDHPIPQLPLYDGRPVGPGGPSEVLWHKHPGANHFIVIHDHEEFGDLIAVRTGMLVDRQTGERTNIAAPLCGNTNYLRAFHEGRVRYPEGEAWNVYGLSWFAEGVRLPTGLSMEELYELWRSLPHATHGHESTSPDWRYIATDGGTTRIVRVRDGQTRSFRLSPDGTNYHLHWRQHPRFFVGWVRGWHFGSYARPEHANIEFQVFSDGTFQPIVDTKHRFNGYYAGGDFSMLSSDATKIHYGSSMTGRFRNYIAVMARPRPPRDPTWRAEGGAVVLSWLPPLYHRETKGYVVYRSGTSGDGYEIATPEPVEGTTWRDDTVEPGRAYYYVVTSMEHSGLESGYSAEVSSAGVDLPAAVEDHLTLYVEAEEAVRDLATDAEPGLAMGVDRFAASDWYYLYRHPESDAGEADLSFRIPADGRYFVWARVRSDRPASSRWRIGIGDRAFEIQTEATDWAWVRADGPGMALSAGDARVTLATGDAAAQLDLLCLTTDPDLSPRGPRPEKLPAPPAITGLRAVNIRPRVNHLTWDRPSDPGLSHYHVYASRGPISEPSQALRVGSPTEEEFIDWGLKAGTRYHYAVTAVNRRGRESTLAIAQAATPEAERPPVEIELAFAEAELTGAFERSEAAGTRAVRYVVPEDSSANRVTWRIDVPHDGEYYFWLRFLQRGSGGRGGVARQEIRALLDGEPLTTLGGGQTDLHVPDALIAPEHPMAPEFWTWAWPGTDNLHAVALPAGSHTLTLRNLAPSVRYDVLVITNEPSFVPRDGRLRQN